MGRQSVAQVGYSFSDMTLFFHRTMFMQDHSPVRWTIFDDRHRSPRRGECLARPCLKGRRKRNGYTCPPCPPHSLMSSNKCCFIYSGDACQTNRQSVARCRRRRLQKLPKASSDKRGCHLPENTRIPPSNDDDDCAFELALRRRKAAPGQGSWQCCHVCRLPLTCRRNSGFIWEETCMCQGGPNISAAK